MKKFILLCMMVVLSGISGTMVAQDKSGLSDKALSAQYKYDIELLDSEIKTTKVKLKADQQNVELRSELEKKQAQLKELKAKKKIIDNAIKSKAASEKQAKKAEKAADKAEKAQKDAQRLKESEKGK